MKYHCNANMLLRIIYNTCRKQRIYFSSEIAQPGYKIPESSVENTTSEEESLRQHYFRCSESNPAKHTQQHECKFYRIEPDVHKTLFGLGGFTREFQKTIKTFNECCIMIRSPALEIMNYMSQAHYKAPVVRYVLYGRVGTGKTLSLAHIIHYAYGNGFLLIHAPWVPFWTRTFSEVATSTSRPGRIDHPVEAVTWLQHFKAQNSHLLKELTISQDYVWSKREITEKGKPLTDIIEQGINRVKFSSDCVAAILKEVKILSSLGRIKTLVAVDGANALFDETRVKRDDRSLVDANDLTLVRAFRKMLRNDWSNGAVVAVADEIAAHINNRSSVLPRYLFGKEGFEILDPFVPVQVNNFSLKEIHSCLDYYIDCKWIQTPKGSTEEGKKELIFLSGSNPNKLSQICAVW